MAVLTVLTVLAVSGAVAALLLTRSPKADPQRAAYYPSAPSDASPPPDPASSALPTPTPTSSSPGPSPTAPARGSLQQAMTALLAGTSTTVSVGVDDLTTGVTETYNAQDRIDTASIIKVDLLATLLLQAQAEGRVLTAQEEGEAAPMIEISDDDSATSLWDEVGDVSGMEQGDSTLGLTQTAPGASNYWGTTTTSVTDQLKLLDDLVSPSSPLSSASRHYVLDLMQQVEASQAWGVSAAADSGTTPAVKDGWFQHSDTGLWVVTSIGVITSDGHTLLVAVLTDNQPSVAAGEQQIEDVTDQAVHAVIGER